MPYIYGSTTSANGIGLASVTKDDINRDAGVGNYKNLNFWQGTALESYTSTYDANGGSDTMTNSTAWRDAAFTLPGSWVFTAPSGMRCKAWAIGSTSGLLVYGHENHLFAADPTVYAVWEDSSAACAEIDDTGYDTLQKK